MNADVETVLRAVLPREASDQMVVKVAAALAPLLAARERAAKAEALTEAANVVQAVFDLQCPPGLPDTYVDRGAWMAHSWWDTVLGGALRRLRDRAVSHADQPAPCGSCGEPGPYTITLRGRPVPACLRHLNHWQTPASGGVAL